LATAVRTKTQLLRSPREVRFDALPPLALYVHLPWCERKCPYCDFNSHERPAVLPEGEYVDALLRNLEALLPSVWGRRIHSIFIGGGTPSLFSARAIDELLAGVRARLTIEPGAEVTLEANPGSAEAARFRGYRDAGVNRVSLGVQSFDDRMLGALGRVHNAEEARRAVESALAVFGNVNLDLMYGLPAQTLEMARADLEAGIASGVPHLSAYQLTIEPNTVFFARPPKLPEHDKCADMQVLIEELLKQNDFEHYEISAFAKPGHRCRHNLNYWEFGDYLGIGAGAHGKLSFADRVTRHEQPKQPREFLKSFSVENRTIGARELPFEFMLNALRLVEGFPLDLFESRTGLLLHQIQKKLDEGEKKKLLDRSGARIRPTERGRHFLDDLVALFLPAPE
jgi:putative oxygen-independent coproporphyrinogen III oxidase